MPVIEVAGLRKEYRGPFGRRTRALAGLDLSVPAGGVFGFLGPNGSGKTTTIRCLLGLVRPSGGATRLLGAGPDGLAAVARRVGSMVETPQFFPNFSGRRNLELLARLDRIDTHRIDDALELVGLGARARSPFRTYSLGMKQRLGLAAALVKDPEVLILDEPANGLDPAGIKEIRDLVRRLGSEGRTVFVSSHLLGEVQQMCDRVAIVAGGRLVTEGPVGEVLARGRGKRLIVKAQPLDGALATLRAAHVPAAADGDRILVELAPDEAARVTRVLADSRIYVSELRPEEVDLETVFLELTGGEGAPST
ncbi:MAG TPA: ATP-binding cassette domain-containing protein [Acidimicrobiia bacterium]